MNQSPAANGVTSKYHQHPLKFVNYKQKTNKAYSGGFICNQCRNHYGSDVDNLYCVQCSYDLCHNCRRNEEVVNLE